MEEAASIHRAPPIKSRRPAFCTWNLPAVDPNNANPYNYAIVKSLGLVTDVTARYNRTAKDQQIPQNTLVPKNFRSWESDFYRSGFLEGDPEPDDHCGVALLAPATCL